jgi:hypothetical protein
VNPGTGKLLHMTTELDVLRRVSTGLTTRGLPFMLTGSFAMAHYATPRMTRDMDIVVALKLEDIDAVVSEFSSEFYVDSEAALAAIESERLFNMMHQASGIKIDLIVRKSTDYRRVEFDRRRRVILGTVDTWIVSREDLILSKLVWARDSQSEMQRRDVEQLLEGADLDRDYLRSWATRLGVDTSLGELWR